MRELGMANRLPLVPAASRRACVGRSKTRGVLVCAWEYVLLFKLIQLLNGVQEERVSQLIVMWPLFECCYKPLLSYGTEWHTYRDTTNHAAANHANRAFQLRSSDDRPQFIPHHSIARSGK